MDTFCDPTIFERSFNKDSLKTVLLVLDSTVVFRAGDVEKKDVDAFGKRLRAQMPLAFKRDII